MSDIGNHIVLAESFEDNEETFVNNEEITKDNECPASEEESNVVPKVGMKFNEEKDIFEFYKRYAYHVGFPVKRRSSRKGEDGVLSYNSAVVEAGGYENLTFVEKDCRNYIDQVRRLRLGEGDAAAIQAYFSKMQAFSPSFYFSVDLDEDGRLKNVFWADNRCRQSFKEFGNVVTFDTTYLTNRYDMPFAPFVGVNHHGQSILLGCGIISNEDTRTFVWLFRTWLECMEDQAPAGIITDQDRAMQNAIEIVFPNTKHRWCLWHILKKLPEKFGNHSCKAYILSGVHEVVYESQSPEEFEEAWNSMIEKYALHDNDWLSGLYKERGRWVPCFMKTSFWAGMSTKQRSEGMNAFFDGYVHSKTSLKQFVEQYERAMRCKVEKEFQADVRSFSQMVSCVSRLGIEKQFQEVYTIAKFKEFQEELTGKIYCSIVSTEEGPLRTSCHMFEFKGIICRHAGTILIQNGVRSIPERYILRRWRRDVSRSYMRVKINYNGWISTPSQLRYDQLCSAFAKVADKVADDEERTRATMEWIQSQLNASSPSNTNPSYGSNIYAEHSVQEQVRSCGEIAIGSSMQIMDPICSQRKGAPRKLRKKGPLETRTKKAKVGSSKSNKGNAPIQNIVKDAQVFNQAFSQDAQYQALPPFNHSQQLMLVSWNVAYGVPMVPTSRTAYPMYPPHLQPNDNPPEI
ncbi:protein FAR1-RELATED SEQUENCE 5-like [Diospyros lotus]|uniref:protein FAR1-RELATED SEQUENCE 5-like n=1 Tax=Diospyros lotus TaxID=55363 RepID=UPI00224F9884|nr:protein FAR1-RELATED SEQUENCE 5-like [Diospyros lotus]